MIEGTANGVTGSINRSTEITAIGVSTGRFLVHSSGNSLSNSSWISMGKIIEPWLKLEKNQALGGWIKGDGNGELLNLRSETPEQFLAGVRGDHLEKIDFEGWKYFEHCEIESAEFINYTWTGSEISSESVMKDLFAYKPYLHFVQFDKVIKRQLWYINLPAGKEVSCVVVPVKAMQTFPGSIKNPFITMGGEKIDFPFRMKSGIYIEFRSSADCKTYGSKGK